MDVKKLHKKINESNLSKNAKHCLNVVVSEFDYFLMLKRKCNGKGLMTACYKDLGVKFMGMYAINSEKDIINICEKGNLLGL